MVATRHDDDTGAMPLSGGRPPHSPVKITREIPLWGILTVIGAFAAQAIGLYYSNLRLADAFSRQGQQLDSVAADVRAITSELNRGNVRGAQIEFQIGDLQRRITAIEAMAQQPRR